MQFTVNKAKYNSLSLMRRLGYSRQRNGSYARRLGTNQFPKFHIYLKEDNSNIEISLHLDQKKVSYSNQKMHSGEYDSDVLEKEKQRIKKLLVN